LLRQKLLVALRDSQSDYKSAEFHGVMSQKWTFGRPTLAARNTRINAINP